MRRLPVALVALLAAVTIAATGVPVAAQAGEGRVHHAVTTGSHDGATPTLAQCQQIVRSQLKVAGKMTIATDNPVYPPWFISDRPTNGQGFESALAYLMARELGFSSRYVRWVVEPFSQSYQAGTKNFDFDVNEITVTPARVLNVSFTSSYYDLQQSLVALKSNAIVHHHAEGDLVRFVYGALSGSSSMKYIINKIKPTKTPKGYSSINGAVKALQSHAIDAFVIDTPTGNTVVNFNLWNTATNTSTGVQVGQFPPVGDLYYAMLLQKSNKLTTCLNVALAAAKSAGLVRSLRLTWLKIYNAVPTLTP